ncbi:thiopurine S-methyltransferase [Lysobacter sp. GX 14042]|uniref:thiopurine S-methyltransferase n=1 Tax=Lysobacter sp. GX 14042 TaxID=2907155 RepID=UPI001F1FE180|nr:thiopurine S-methyltransferase [Lysobacter sp. GX 14042]MCE7031447.1 thiopurine S-methyltransferase [Lysobacter sp. GX 14042]
MDTRYWQDRWTEGRTGWHQDQPTPLLLKHWPALDVAPGSRVFVPLAGKSQDMRWLAAQGHRVLGVELSQLAVERFFAENGLAPRVSSTRYGRHYEAGGIEIICGDAFGLDSDALRDCRAVFDRAALIALPPPLRRRYAAELYACLPAGCRGLLLTIEYPQEEKEGPPFSVPGDEVRSLFSADWSVGLLERRDIPVEKQDPQERVIAQQAVAYQLIRR